MKNILIVLSILSPAFAFAMPKVGDRATYNVTNAQGAVTLGGSLTFELVSYNAATKQFTQKTTQVFGTEIETREEAVAEEELFDDATLNGVLVKANCESSNGSLEKIKVAAGEFNTCKLIGKSDDGLSDITTWVGLAPFAVIKYLAVTPSEQLTVKVELASYSIAK